MYIHTYTHTHVCMWDQKKVHSAEGRRVVAHGQIKLFNRYSLILFYLFITEM